MKKILMLSIFIFGLFNVYSQTQITLTFTAKDSVSQNPVSLDSVYVKNLTEDCDTLLYGPDPVLSLIASWPVGINETGANSPEAFILKQNYPNPFQGSTFVSIYREYRGPLNLMLIDGLGTKLAEYENEFEKGFHSFVISSSGNKVLILVVSDDKNYRSIKIVCTGQSDECSTIRYLGLTHPFEKSISATTDNSGFIFYLGNQMMYTAYANGYHDNTKFDNPTTSTTYTFNMTPLIPTVTTSPVTNITQTTATSGGNVIADGGATVTARGVCWNTSSNPTTANSHTTDGSGTGTFVSNLTGLTLNTLYYVRAYATNSVGTAYGNEVSFTTAGTFNIGQSYGGGIIFYIDGTGQHGLIAATSDQSTGAEWGCVGTLIGGTSTAIGSGQANTTIIVNGCSQAGIAARICDDLILNGYSDWFLPSKDELNQMYIQRTVIGGFTTYAQWSSSEYDANGAWSQFFGNGSTQDSWKWALDHVRAVRAF